MLGFLWLEKRGLGVAVTLLATASSVIALVASFPFENYLLQSIAVLLVAAASIAVFAFGGRPGLPDLGPPGGAPSPPRA